MGSTYQSCRTRRWGVPQGSILSPAVFNIKTKTNIKTKSSNIGKAVFTETAPGLLRVLPCMHTGQFMQRAMKLVCVNNARNWVLENRFKYFTSKTVLNILLQRQYAYTFNSSV